MIAEVTRFSDSTLFGDTTFFQTNFDLLAYPLVTGQPFFGVPAASIISVFTALTLATGKPFFGPVIFVMKDSGSVQIGFVIDTQQDVLIGGSL